MKSICNTRENRTITDVTPGALIRVHASTMTMRAAVMILASSIANAGMITGYAWRSLISRRRLPFSGMPDLVRVGIMIGMVTGMFLISVCPQVLADSGPPWASTTLDNLSYIEQDGWNKLDTDVTVTSGTNDFSDGYIEVNITNANSYDELRLVSNGSLSVSGDAVYWSDSRIGTINNAYDGSNGQLRIDFSAVAPLSNADFETGDLTGWTVNDNYPGVNEQAWVESPLDDPDVSTVDTSPRIDDHNSVPQSTSVQSGIINEGTYALKLTISGNVLTSFGTAHGPMVTSSTFTAAAGDSLSVNWNAIDGGDWYDVYGFIFKDANNDEIWDTGESYQKLFHDVGSTTNGWIKTDATVASNVAGENIRFVFLNGNYDKTGGRGIGSSLYIDGITLEISNTAVANDNIVSHVIKNIEYNNTNDDPVTTKDYNLNFKQSNGGTGFNTAHINIIAVNDPPNAPISPKCEGQTNPVDVTDFTPEFGWTFSDIESGDTQGAYQIIVGTTQGSDDMWNSNKVVSSSFGEISYSGSALSPGTTYHWKVKTWDNQDVEGSYCADQTFITIGPTLTLSSIGSISSDWGRVFNINHSVTISDANVSNVNIIYNVSWLTECTPGTMDKDATAWCNQTNSNLTVQEITVGVNANTTTSSATNDSETFLVTITRRDITITADPESTQYVGVEKTFLINASAKDEHDGAFIAKADLIREGIIVDTTNVVAGNANFSRTEPAYGTFNFSVRFYNTTHYNNKSTSNSSITVVGSALALGNIIDITRDWGRDFDLNHSVTVTNANANNVKVSYNVSWIPGNTTFGTVSEDMTKWHNQSIYNSTVQNITVKVDATTTSTSAINDTATFSVNLTRRDITVITNPGSTQSRGVDESFWINASAKDEYEDTFICKADLIREGSVIETQNISSGNVNFSRTEPLGGTFNFSIRFYNTTHYNNESTSNSSVTINGPGLTLGNVNDITSDWGRSFSMNHSVTVTDANANNVNVTYNVSWIPDNSTMGTIAKDGTKWHNQSITNSTVQEIKVKVDVTSTSGSVINDSKTFQVNITKRNIEITSAPESTQSVILGQTFRINASVSDEHEDNLICKADLIREGNIIENQTVTNGNAHFSTTEPAAGTFNFSIIFYNTTHYNNATTSNCAVSVADITPPIITNITNTTPTSDSVTISWNTDENSDSLVRYGTVNGTYDLSKSSATMVTSHTVTLTGLSHNTVYHFVVNSTDNSNNSNESAEYNFTTKCTYATISGLVTDSSTGHPIHNATVSTGGMTIYTWTDGTYTIQSIAPGMYTLNVSASGYLWNNSTVLTVSSGVISRANVTLTPEKVKLALHNSETTSVKSAPNDTQVIFELSATNYGTNATFTITNTSDATIVSGCSSFILNSSESKDFNITATNQIAGYYPIKITVSNSSLSKSTSVTFYAIMQNMSANYTKKGSCTVNTTNKASVTGNSILVNSTVDTGANVNDSTLVHANVTGGANVTGESLVQNSNITGSGSVVGNGSVVEYSTVDNSTMVKGVISRNSIVVDSALDNTTLTDSGLYGKTTITDSTVVNVTANKSTIIGVGIDTGYSITLTNVTVKASARSGKGGRPEIQGGTNANVITRGVNFTNIYTDVLVEDLVLQYIGNKTAQKNTSMTINASNTVKCDLTVNMTEPAIINITETGINPDGEGTESILSEDTLKWVPVGSFIYIQHNASGEGNFTLRRYYDPSLNYTEVYIYYYNTTLNMNVWERLETTANGTKGGLNWIEAVVNHLSTFVLMGTLGDEGDDSGSSSVTNSKGGRNRRYIKPTPTVLAIEVQTGVPVSGDMAASGRIETGDDEAFGHGVDTGTDESTSTQTGNKGLLIFGLLGVIVGVIIIVLVIRRKNE